LPTSPVWQGYTFEGWNTKADGKGTAFKGDAPVTADIAVYAMWKPLPPNSITITFDTNGGTPKPAPKVVPIGSDYGPLPTVSRSGCKFLGWANDLGDADAKTKIPFANSHTLYAIWDKPGPDPTPTPPSPKPDYSAYQSLIQGKCNFHDPQGVWNVIEKYSDPEALYKKLAENMSRSNTKEEYKKIIQILCNFDDPDGVWAVLEKHGWADDVYRKLVQGLVGK